MRRSVLVLVLALATVVALASAVGAQQPAQPGQFPNVANLEPFSAATNFMSLPGYLRWLMFQQTGNWITYQEAARVVAEQQAQ